MRIQFKEVLKLLKSDHLTAQNIILIFGIMKKDQVIDLNLLSFFIVQPHFDCLVFLFDQPK